MNKPIDFLKAALITSFIACGIVTAHAQERADLPGEIRIAVLSPTTASEVVRGFGWAEQEFAKVNKRVVWTHGSVADAIWGEDGRLVPTSTLLGQRPDAAERLARIDTRAQQWLGRNAQTSARNGDSSARQ